MTFDALGYWITRGKDYLRQFQRSPAFDQQELALTTYLSALDYSSVLEIGCGFGRITELVRPTADKYVAIDVSPDQIEAARERVLDVEYWCSSIEDWTTTRTFDLVLAVEVLMHVPPSRMPAVVSKMLDLSNGHVVTVDWTGEGVPSRHNWRHDYATLFPQPRVVPIGSIGQSIFHVARVDRADA